MPGAPSTQLRYRCLPLLAGTLLSTGALADEKKEIREFPGKPSSYYSQEIDSKTFKSIKFGKGFKVKGWRIGEGVYFGGVKVDGEYGPGVVFDNGSYVWGFNHERIQFELRF